MSDSQIGPGLVHRVRELKIGGHELIEWEVHKSSDGNDFETIITIDGYEFRGDWMGACALAFATAREEHRRESPRG